jgi:hypothetical protein
MLRDMIFKHAQSIQVKKGIESGEKRASQQLREWDQQAYNYDLTLARAEGDTFPSLKKMPALIKQYSEQGEDKIFQWGDVNGEWQLTELDSDAKKLFAHLNFPDTSNKLSITSSRDQITTGMYDALKKGHTLTHFDLDEYVRVTDAFLKKYPANVPVPQAQWDACDTDSYKIGHAQKKFPAWLAAIWCSAIPFHPLSDVKRLIAAPDVCRLKLYYGEDFFDGRLGRDFSIHSFARAGTRVAARWRVLRSGIAAVGGGEIDLVAMATLCKVITEELGKSKQLLSEESKSTPGQGCPI